MDEVCCINSIYVRSTCEAVHIVAFSLAYESCYSVSPEISRLWVQFLYGTQKHFSEFAITVILSSKQFAIAVTSLSLSKIAGVLNIARLDGCRRAMACDVF